MPPITFKSVLSFFFLKKWIEIFWNLRHQRRRRQMWKARSKWAGWYSADMRSLSTTTLFSYSRIKSVDSWHSRPISLYSPLFSFFQYLLFTLLWPDADPPTPSRQRICGPAGLGAHTHNLIHHPRCCPSQRISSGKLYGCCCSSI